MSAQPITRRDFQKILALGIGASAMPRRGVLVGRPFPPMNDYLCVSIGTQEQMNRFVEIIEEVMG